MHSIQFEITKPTGEAEFEDMCANVYGEVFDDPAPQKNGRRGQAQSGIDVFIKSPKHGRVGIQCKRYADGKLTLKHVEAEIAAADKGKVAVNRLIVSTTAANDSKLVSAVQRLSDMREAEGKFPVQVDGWEDVCRHVRSHLRLQHSYAPNAPGAALYNTQQGQTVLLEKLEALKAQVGTLGVALPDARIDSTNKYLTSQLDAVNELLKACRFEEADLSLIRLGSDLSIFDVHQLARWHLQRANCSWHAGRKEDAADDFLRAAELYPDDEKMAAAGVRGLLLQVDETAALERAESARTRWPASLTVWLVYANALMANARKLRINDAPAHLRNEPDVLQTVAWAQFKQGNLKGAIALAMRGAKASGASFFTRAAALAFALQKAAGNAAAFSFDAIADADMETLRQAVALFNDRAGRLWAVQARPAVDDAAANLTLAFVVLGQYDDTLSVVNEAKVRGVLTGKLVRHEIEALRRKDQSAEGIARGLASLHLLEEDGLPLLAELAANQGDVATVALVKSHVDARYPSNTKLAEGMTAIRWFALCRASRHAEAMADVSMADLALSSSLTLVCAGARVFLWSDQPAKAEPLVDRARYICGSKSTEEARLLLAELLFAAERFAQAATAFSEFVKPGQHTELHNRLLCCYVRTGARQKARQLLEKLPAGWTEDDSTRGLAVELAHRAGDFATLRHLSEVQVRNAPDKASSWTFRVTVALRTLGSSEFRNLVESMPDILNGGHRQLAQLSSVEFKYGDKRKAMRRLYEMYRRDLDSPEAASAYAISIISAGDEVPFLEESVETAAAGTTLTLIDDFGTTLEVPIDPDDVDIPPSGNFCSANDAEVVALIGSRIGDEVSIPGSFGQTRTFRVSKISSTYRHLLNRSHALMTNSVKAAEGVMSVPIPMRSGHSDFSYLHEQLKRISEQGKMVLEAYAEGHLTIGLCAKMLGKNAIELVSGWPVTGPALEVCGGTSEEVQAAESLLANSSSAYVVDTATLAELAELDCLAALDALPRVFVSSTTKDIIFNELEEAKDERASGRAVDVDGEMRYVPLTEEDKARRVGYLQSMVDAIQTYCEVVPVYGPVEPHEDLIKAETVLQPDEHAALLLSSERGATLFSLDWRLRRFAKSFGVEGVWIQPVLVFAARAGKLPITEFSLSSTKQLLRNRSFISINAWDLVAMCMQGGAWLQAGMRRVKDYLASSATDQLAVISMVQEFLVAQASLRTSWSACGELLSHLSEAIFRRSDVSSAAEAMLVEHALGFVQATVGPLNVYGEQPAMREERFRRFSNLLVAKIREGKLAAEHGTAHRHVRVEVLYCSIIPTLIQGEIEPEPIVEAASPDIAYEAPTGRAEGDLSTAMPAHHDHPSAMPPSFEDNNRLTTPNTSAPRSQGRLRADVPHGEELNPRQAD